MLNKKSTQEEETNANAIERASTANAPNFYISNFRQPANRAFENILKGILQFIYSYLQAGNVERRSNAPTKIFLIQNFYREHSRARNENYRICT